MSSDEERRIGWRRTRQDIRADVDSEIEFHLAVRAAELERRGYTPAEARAEAQRRFGDVAETRAVCASADVRRERRRNWLEHGHEALQDARLGWRQLVRRPAFTTVAVLTLGLGIGANAAIFAAVDRVMLRDLPYPDAQRVVTLWETDERSGQRKKEMSPGNYLDVHERSAAFSAVGVVEPYAFDVLGDGPPESVPAWRVSEGWFDALGVRPRLGRLFEPTEYTDAPRVALISEGYWQRRFGGSPDVIGRTIRLDEGTAEIVGVLSHAQMHPEHRDLWVPRSFTPGDAADRRSAYMPAVARLASGVPVASAQTELDRIAAELAAAFPQSNTATGFNVVPLEDHLLGAVRPALMVLVWAVAFLLLIACTNLASLQLARGAERRRELSVRAALGARRGRLVRQLVTESAVLMVLGGTAGLLIAHGGIRAFAATAPPGLPALDTLSLDARALAFLILVTAVAGVLSGALPALRHSRPDVMTPLRGGRGAGDPRRQRLRAALVTVQIAVALTLLVGAGLLARSFIRLTDNDLGFATEQRSYLQTFIWDRNPTAEQRIQRVNDMLERIAALPTVHSVAAVSALPFHPHAITAQGGVRFDDRPQPAAEEVPRVYVTVATPGYFEVTGIDLVRGRAFTSDDRAELPAVAIVNEAFVREHYRGEDPLGRPVTIGVMGAPLSREIVGVVRDVKPTAFDADARPELYVPHAQHGTGSLTFVVLGRGGIPSRESLQAAVWQTDPQQTLYSTGTLVSLVGETVRARRFQLMVVGLVSLLAFALATLGVYGLISFWVRVRTHEIGVRMALGARPGEIARLIIGQALRLTLPGLLAGVIGAALFARMLSDTLYATSPVEPLVYLQLTGLVLAAATLAAWLPARRTLREDPLRALRAD